MPTRRYFDETSLTSSVASLTTRVIRYICAAATSAAVLERFTFFATTLQELFYAKRRETRKSDAFAKHDAFCGVTCYFYPPAGVRSNTF